MKLPGVPKGELRRMKRQARKDWFFEEGKEHRLVCVIIGVTAVLLVTGIGFLVWNSPLSAHARIGIIFVVSALATCVACVLSFMAREDM